MNNTIHTILPDNNECSDDTDDCSHMCTNTIGSYVCGCDEGYHLDDDDATCIGMY